MILFLVEVALFELLVCPEMEPWFHFLVQRYIPLYVATPCTKRCYINTLTPSLLYIGTLIGTLGIMLLNFDCVSISVLS